MEGCGSKNGARGFEGDESAIANGGKEFDGPVGARG